MTILNKEHWPYIVSFGNLISDCVSIEYFTGKSIYFKFIDEAIDCWYIEFLHGDAFYFYPISKLITTSLLEKLKNGEIKLILCHRQEAYKSVIKQIYDYIVLADGVDPENIVLLTNNHDIISEIEFVSNLHKTKQIKAILLHEFELRANYYANNIEIADSSIIAKQTLNKDSYIKKFLSLNGLERPHRVTLVSLLKIYELLEKGHVSFSNNLKLGGPFNGYYYYNNLCNWYYEDTELSRIIKTNKEKLFDLTSMWLDTTVETNTTMGDYLQSMSYFYEDTYFSVVTETLCMKKFSCDGFTGPGLAYSEKTFKPILNKHPFIILGLPGILKALKARGYKTFEPFIDESYDDETNDEIRILKVFKEVEKLTNMPDERLKEFIEFAKPITEYNFENLKSKKIFKQILN